MLLAEGPLSLCGRLRPCDGTLPSSLELMHRKCDRCSESECSWLHRQPLRVPSGAEPVVEFRRSPRHGEMQLTVVQRDRIGLVLDVFRVLLDTYFEIRTASSQVLAGSHGECDLCVVHVAFFDPLYHTEGELGSTLVDGASVSLGVEHARAMLLTTLRDKGLDAAEEGDVAAYSCAEISSYETYLEMRLETALRVESRQCTAETLPQLVSLLRAHDFDVRSAELCSPPLMMPPSEPPTCPCKECLREEEQKLRDEEARRRAQMPPVSLQLGLAELDGSPVMAAERLQCLRRLCQQLCGEGCAVETRVPHRVRRDMEMRGQGTPEAVLGVDAAESSLQRLNLLPELRSLMAVTAAESPRTPSADRIDSTLTLTSRESRGGHDSDDSSTSGASLGSNTAAPTSASPRPIRQLNSGGDRMAEAARPTHSISMVSQDLAAELPSRKLVGTDITLPERIPWSSPPPLPPSRGDSDSVHSRDALRDSPTSPAFGLRCRRAQPDAIGGTLFAAGIPRIHIVRSAGPCTLVGVNALDRPGLAYDMTRAIAEHGLEIHSALLTTTTTSGDSEEDEATAVHAHNYFEVTLPNRRPLWLGSDTQPSRSYDELCQELRLSLVDAIGNPVLVRNMPDGTATMIEISCDERHGLLCDVVEALHSMNLQLLRARIRSHGIRTRDRFHVTDAWNQPVAREFWGDLRQGLLSAVMGVDCSILAGASARGRGATSGG
ncbi:hypothetical protein CDCA_CDCA09G2585 [Cyanidium caldarium]|uniref:ACT domain-containing protein n=1 Tax=Cyanidium caldarium TaxID=2771 RepID=A0AAV9IWR9_CYACA|nr:hypothetical protein CDCA_CDCA09G2585 [Cyanidium caldarium]